MKGIFETMLEAFNDVVKALNSYGPAIVVVAALLTLNGFFIYRDYLRELRLQKQLEELQKVHNEVVVPLLTSCREAIASCKEVINQNSTIINNWVTNGRR